MFRYPARPLYSLEDELDRLYEQWPANERPPFPPSPVSAPSLPPIREQTRCTPSPLDDNSGLGAAVPTNSKQPRRVNAEAA